MKKLFTIGVLAGALAFAGCSGAQEQSDQANDRSDCPVEADATITTTARIAYQHIANADLIVKDRGWLEACMPKATIEWIKADSGASVIKDFGARSIDMGLNGSSPTAKLLSPDLNESSDVVVMWIHDVIGAAESLVVKDSSITEVAGLKGKKIAVPFASTAHYSLLAALGRAGLTSDDVTLINLTPDKMLAAWEQGDIDAAWVWNPVLAELLTDGTLLVSAEETAEQGAPTYDLGIADRGFVQANQDFIAKWTEVQDAAVTLAASDPAKASESIGAVLGVSPQEAAEQTKGLVLLNAASQADAKYLGGGLGTDIFNTAEFLASQGEVASAEAESVYVDALYSAAAEQVGK